MAVCEINQWILCWKTKNIFKKQYSDLCAARDLAGVLGPGPEDPLRQFHHSLQLTFRIIKKKWLYRQFQWESQQIRPQGVENRASHSLSHSLATNIIIWAVPVVVGETSREWLGIVLYIFWIVPSYAGILITSRATTSSTRYLGTNFEISLDVYLGR